MYFDLTSEQKIMRESLNGLLSSINSDAEIMRKYDSTAALDQNLWQRLVDMGLTGILAPEEYGGLGMDLLTLAVVAEMLGYHAVSAPMIEHSMAVLAISEGGTAEQKERLLPALVAGEKIATCAWRDEGGWRPEQWSTKGLQLSGHKSSVVFAADCDLILVGLESGNLGLVEGDAAGVKVVAKESLDRTRRIYDIDLDNVEYETLGGAIPVTNKVFEAALILHAADAFGAASQTLEMAVSYANIREQFGRSIGQFQAVKHQLANIACEVEPCRGLFWYAAHAWDQNLEGHGRLAAVAKAHITEIAVSAVRMAVEVHGGIGYTWEYALHVWLKRTMFDRAILGLPQEHRRRAADLAEW